MDEKLRNEEILKAEQDALDSVLVEAFALVKETCRRMWTSRWYLVMK